MSNFNPNDIGVANGNFFGLPHNINDCTIALLSVPWDATTSYSDGTSEGPEAIMNASLQVDLFDENIEKAWETKIGTIPTDDKIITLNSETRAIAKKVIATLSEGGEASSADLEIINSASEKINNYVASLATTYLNEGKIVGVVGGEHSVPLGLLKALSNKYDKFGILHIDAHADLRVAYEGFTYSHASIMYNALNEIPQVSCLTQVAVRDFCSDEFELMTKNEKINAFSDSYLSKQKFLGSNWDKLCDEIITTLPENIYISFDIDGLLPELCPSTGTPVPGGLSFREMDYLLLKLAESGKKIIGFDLCEVSPSKDNEWDANVGARVLFKLALYTQKTLIK